MFTKTLTFVILGYFFLILNEANIRLKLYQITELMFHLPLTTIDFHFYFFSSLIFIFVRNSTVVNCVMDVCSCSESERVERVDKEKISLTDAPESKSIWNKLNRGVALLVPKLKEKYHWNLILFNIRLWLSWDFLLFW